MKITEISTFSLTIPLNTTFKTALRSIDTLENVIVKVETDSGDTGWGAAAPAPVITGETTASILGGIEHLRAHLVEMDVLDYEQLFQKLNTCLLGNMSAKAAVDMALYDLLAKAHNTTVNGFLGGEMNALETDITISLNPLEEMVAETRDKLNHGFKTLKIKVGGDPDVDVERLEAISEAAGEQVQIRIDANQGWTPKQAVYVGKEIEKRKLGIELMEQPVAARDFEGMKFVRDNVALPVYADESVFSAKDALELISMEAVDGINIKLMKCGGIYNGLKIAAIAESGGIPCMIGSMMECSVSVTAAAHFAASRAIIKGYDLDAPLFCSINPADGGIVYHGAEIRFSEGDGLGIGSVMEIQGEK